LYSSEEYDTDSRTWVRYAVNGAYSDAEGAGYQANNGTGLGGIRGGDTVIDNVVYLSDSLVNVTSATGLHLPGIQTDQSPSGSIPVTYYDSHWKWSTSASSANYVDPNAAWTNPTALPGTSAASTQSENPANYVGWTTGTFSVLNADKGDINQLYTDIGKTKQKTTSEAGVWQGYFWDDTLVGTVGYRRD
jgi:hypothetical protein